MFACSRFRELASTRRRVGILLVAAACAIPRPAQAAEQVEPKLVVVLYPQNNDGSPGHFLVDQAIRATISSGSTARVEIYNEYLDVSRTQTEHDRVVQRDYLKGKYSNRQVDLVIAGLSSGLDFALANRDIFAGAPIVYCAVDDRELNNRTLPEDVVGVPTRFDLLGTLDIAIGLHPDTRHVAVVAGGARMDLEWEQAARKAFLPYEDRLAFTYLTGLAFDELLDRVAALPAHSIIFYLHIFKDANGKTFVPAHALEAIAQRANCPIYGHVDTYVGRGIVGGDVFSFEAAGKNAAAIGTRILEGEPAASIGKQAAGGNVRMFDWRQMQRWNVDESRLPPQSIVRYREATFWANYRWYAVGIAGFIIFQTALIVGLLIQRANRRRAELQLRQLAGSLIGAQESERCRIARELHDDFNQSLALISIEIDFLRQKNSASCDDLGEPLENLSSRVREMSSSLHELSHQLHPLKLSQLGLVAAVRQLCRERSQVHGLAIDFTADSTLSSLESHKALCLYRIVQESLRNVVKHSGAKSATVALHAGEDDVVLKVTDSGAGFDASSVAGRGGLGLISMRERLRLVNGTFTINSRPSSGTEIVVRVPLDRPMEHDGQFACRSPAPNLVNARSNVEVPP